MKSVVRVVFVILALIALQVYCACPNSCYYEHGHGECNTTNYCDCTEWWTGDDCSIYGTTRQCVCPDDWTGVACDQCVNDTSCSEQFNKDGKPYICDNSLVVFEQKQLNCTPDDVLFSAFLGAGVIGASCDLPQDNSGVCLFNAYTKPTGPPLLFNCTFSQCSTSFDGVDQYIECEQSVCECTSLCVQVVRDYLESAKTKTTFRCTVEKNTCYITQTEIGLLNESPFTCVARECRDPDASPKYSGEQEENRELKIGIAIGIPVFVFLIIVAIISCHLKQLAREDDGVREFKATLQFQNITCHIRQEKTPLMLKLYRKITKSYEGEEVVQAKRVLTNISGTCKPGEVTAILGPSGSGKTSLLDIISGRKTVGKLEGDITVNGRRRNKRLFRRISGYVSQEDVLLDTLTVKEHLRYIAMFRLPQKMKQEEKFKKVDEVMRDLGLKHIENSRIGNMSHRGISGGERKRVSIASELLVDPSILFLDEPTSGLDSYQAHLLVRTIVELARKKNRTVIMAIHQPRSNIYDLFDQVCLLKDGKQVYFGPANNAASYFSRKGHECPPNYNVPDYLLDVISMLPDNQIDSLVNDEMQKPQQTEVTVDDEDVPMGVIAMHTVDENGLDEIDSNTTEYATTPFYQLGVLVKRSMNHSIRKPSFLRLQYAMGIGIGIVMGAVFYQVSNDFQGGGVTNRLGALFFVGALLSFTSITSIDAFYSERLLFVRERGNGCYRTSSYFFSKLITELFIQKIIPTILTAAISYGMIRFRPGGEHFGIYLVYLLEIATCATCMCLAVSSFSPSVAVGNIIAIILLFLFLLFGGLLVSVSSVPDALSWIGYFSFLQYGFNGMVVNELKGLPLYFNLKGYPAFYMKGDVILNQMSIDINDIYPNIFILIAWIVWYMFWTYIFLRFVVRERR